MTGKIVEVLAKILEGLSNNSSIEDVNHALIKYKKYDQKTLSIAFSLIYDKILTRRIISTVSKKSKNKSIRHLSESELDILGVENYNYLLHLINIGLLDPDNLELILSQIMLFPEEKISRREINWIILLSLVEFDSEILPGSRILLYSSDTVN
jgi:uncharacterized protein Smg (DUF494 family)